MTQRYEVHNFLWCFFWDFDVPQTSVHIWYVWLFTCTHLHDEWLCIVWWRVSSICCTHSNTASCNKSFTPILLASETSAASAAQSCLSWSSHCDCSLKQWRLKLHCAKNKNSIHCASWLPCQYSRLKAIIEWMHSDKQCFPKDHQEPRSDESIQDT